MSVKIAASILSADFRFLGEEIKRVERAGADLIHIDVMDGHFVPNITIGAQVVAYLRKATRLPLDVHLMIKQPQKYIDAFVKAGSDMITVHIETISKSKIKYQKSKLKAQGVKLGISLNPATPLSKIKNVLNLVDFVLVMTVNPGFGGQRFIPEVLPKIRNLRQIYKGLISVDGGVNEQNAKKLIAAGADILAAGSFIFNSKDAKEAIRKLRNAV